MERPVSKPIGQHFLDLDTPALIVNNSRLRTNIENTAEDLMKIGIKLIPNFVTKALLQNWRQRWHRSWSFL